ncbi:MAG: hypothetical protein U1E43_09195 [Rhodospirillales bacterium]
MPCRPNSAAGPSPESIISFGVSKAPQHRITSRSARSVCTLPSAATYSTPVARPASCTTRVVRTPVSSRKLARSRTGRTNAEAAVTRM